MTDIDKQLEKFKQDLRRQGASLSPENRDKVLKIAYAEKRQDIVDLILARFPMSDEDLEKYFLSTVSPSKPAPLLKAQSQTTKVEVPQPKPNPPKIDCSFENLRKTISVKKRDATKEILQQCVFNHQQIEMLVEEMKQKKDYATLKTIIRSGQCAPIYADLLDYFILDNHNDFVQIINDKWSRDHLLQHCTIVLNSPNWDNIYNYMRFIKDLDLKETIQKTALVERAFQHKQWEILRIIHKSLPAIIDLKMYAQKSLAAHNWENIPNLINIGLDINMVLDNGDTLLETCFLHDQDQLVQLLLEKECITDEYKELHNKETLFTLAVKKNKYDFVDFFSSIHAVHPESYNDANLIEYALTNNYTEMIERLLELGIDSDKILSNGQTIFTHYIVEKNEDMLHKILEYSPNLNQKNIIDQSPLFLALENKIISIIPILLQNGASITEVLPTGQTISELIEKIECPQVIDEFQKINQSIFTEEELPKNKNIDLSKEMLMNIIRLKDWGKLKRIARNTDNAHVFNMMLEKELFPNLVFSSKVHLTNFLDNEFTKIYNVLHNIDQKKELPRGTAVKKLHQRPDSDLWEYRYSYSGRILIQRRKNEPNFVYTIDPVHACIKDLKKDPHVSKQ